MLQKKKVVCKVHTFQDLSLVTIVCNISLKQCRDYTSFSHQFWLVLKLNLATLQPCMIRTKNNKVGNVILSHEVL